MKRVPCRNARPALLLTLALLVGCKTTSGDPFARGEQASQRGDFLAALADLDAVPPGHPRYTEARSYAQALERRIRTSYELLLEGLGRRAEWRDEAALQSFEQAKAVWPEVRGVAGLIRATKSRMKVLSEQARADEADRQAQVGEDLVQEEVPTVTTSPIIDTPGPEVVLPVEPEPPAGPATETRPAGPSTPGTGSAKRGDDDEAQRRRRVGLQAVQRRLERGDMARAMELLEDLRSAFPEDRQVAGMLARVLHQRAMLYYGQGRLEAAIDDWDWVVRLQPSNRQAKAFLRAARTEFTNRRRR